MFCVAEDMACKIWCMLQEKLDPGQVDMLARLLYFADQAYDCGTEANLQRLLLAEGNS